MLVCTFSELQEKEESLYFGKYDWNEYYGIFFQNRSSVFCVCDLDTNFFWYCIYQINTRIWQI